MTPEEFQALLDGPALAPPPGVEPQFDNPPNLKLATDAVPITSLIVATLVLMMRIYTRISVVRRFNIADYSVIVGWGVFVAYVGIFLAAGRLSPGIHQWDVRLRDLSPILYYIHVLSVMYGICVFFIKLSIMAQYIEIFLPNREPRALFWSIIVICVANFVFYLVSTFVEIFACSPVAKVWDPLIEGGHCLDTLLLNVAASSVNTASDFIILALPQTLIWRLNTSLKNKLIVSFIFLVAIFACVSSAVRLAYAVVLRRQNDIIYYTWYAGIWTLPELSAGIVVACLPVARKFAYRVAESRVFISLTSTLKPGSNASKSKIEKGNSNDTPDSNKPASDHPSWSRSWTRKNRANGFFSRLNGSSLSGIPTRDTFGTSPAAEERRSDEWELSNVSHT
ncbi:hypothetical protein FHL15_001728 [Xylaria flabelliformis]|uniref:Rhodopsin domain-containing protein n=1 Tax=Xylaria flabelliformis TaxID=2512241 RepID=A0A553IB72_9PEZI|nr:hypothetical protein FHL15_001728 [Xylaria flabelliformis]